MYQCLTLTARLYVRYISLKWWYIIWFQFPIGGKIRGSTGLIEAYNTVVWFRRRVREKGNYWWHHSVCLLCQDLNHLDAYKLEQDLRFCLVYCQIFTSDESFNVLFILYWVVENHILWIARWTGTQVHQNRLYNNKSSLVKNMWLLWIETCWTKFNCSIDTLYFVAWESVGT